MTRNLVALVFSMALVACSGMTPAEKEDALYLSAQATYAGAHLALSVAIHDGRVTPAKAQEIGARLDLAFAAIQKAHSTDPDAPFDVTTALNRAVAGVLEAQAMLDASMLPASAASAPTVTH